MKRQAHYRVAVEFLVTLSEPDKQDARDATQYVLNQLKAEFGSGARLIIDGYKTTVVRNAEKTYHVERFPKTPPREEPRPSSWEPM